MPDAALEGRTYAAPQPFTVTEERLAAFAAATGSTYSPGGPAPATFAIVPMFEALGAMIIDPSTGLDLTRIVHGAQKFTHARPIVAGDVLEVSLEVLGVRRSAGLEIISTSTSLAVGEEHVCTAEATIIHRGEAA